MHPLHSKRAKTFMFLTLFGIVWFRPGQNHVQSFLFVEVLQMPLADNLRISSELQQFFCFFFYDLWQLCDFIVEPNPLTPSYWWFWFLQKWKKKKNNKIQILMTHVITHLCYKAMELKTVWVHKKKFITVKKCQGIKLILTEVIF